MEIVVNDVSYYVEICGRGDPLLLLHGFTGSSETWKPFIPNWEKHFQMVMVDLLGHGKTACPADVERYNIERVAADLTTLLDQLGMKKAHVLGYSMGGRLALTLAVKHPTYVQTLILESSSPGLKTEEERAMRRMQDEQLASFIEQHGIEAFVERWENIPLFASHKKLPKAVREHLRHERLKNKVVGLANSLRGMGTGTQPSWWNHLTNLTMPTLLICGEEDEKFCRIAEEMVQLLPNGVIAHAKRAGHTIHLEQPEFFVKIVNEFIFKGGTSCGN
ncbi:2-succinyl-6-hydroxy-2,4-cyclohexadiene-1-carboxylate synthase [Thermolongibacillus altinsuensis]|jgi:2-succinyl-6-hydroxy-2,4-cyclohexadiene-1-carboxylate synthase|uniref:2-succinyl-6-hydroxy-2, 4-cyclohexadiene-1-carboxylate synthase n=1 Tax=Thermolongibacillus altinsuensis TaxID=575256 RepID=UPI00242A308F|nr:2-succinyl-6-hydroxy-2,4-cyclohexadiene-1-carboxylate synthase [Thermolongibacillus altinsuensis]GMB09902.1 putative 2-succinyl-6-hydroxy-2,4-cyclohexadiene-1-carboxylate synthase [Thermolongibacillus altinsuensis]